MNSKFSQSPKSRLPGITSVGRLAVFLLYFGVTSLGQSLNGQIGFTEPYRTIQLGTTETGIIRELHVEVGQSIKQGEPIASLDDDLISSNLKIAEQKVLATGRITAAKASLEFKKTNLNKIEALFKKNHANDQEVMQAKLDFELAKAQLQSLMDDKQLSKLEVDRIKAQLRRRTIYSTVDGTIVSINHEKGESIAGASSQIATIVNLSKLKVRFFVNYQQAINFRVNSKISVYLSNKKEAVEGKIRLVSPVVESKSGTVSVEVEIDNHQGELQSGIRCSLSQSRSDLAVFKSKEEE